MTEAVYEELLALALGNQRLAQENQKILVTVQVKMAEAHRELLKVVENQSRRLDRIESL